MFSFSVYLDQHREEKVNKNKEFGGLLNSSIDVFSKRKLFTNRQTNYVPLKEHTLSSLLMFVLILTMFLSPVAFLFNWIGFLLSFCLTTSAAGRYGAISGFGLSLIKWVLIVRVRSLH